jgi:opacity protein-like surface antigen
MISNRARTVLVLAALLTASVPAWAQQHSYRERSYERDGAFRLRLGAFRPDGDSDYWNDKKLDFTGDVSDFEDASVGADYLLSLNRHVGVLFSGSYYQGNASQSYRDFVDNHGDRIRHDTTLDIGSLTAGLMLHLTGPDSPIIPYVGAGGGLYSWRLEESGDFIDFNTPHRDIFSANLKSDGVGFGYYVLAGLEAPITRRVSVFAEGRWTKVDDDLNGDFEGFGKLDLSGREVSAGISWNL